MARAVTGAEIGDRVSLPGFAASPAGLGLWEGSGKRNGDFASPLGACACKGNQVKIKGRENRGEALLEIEILDSAPRVFFSGGLVDWMMGHWAVFRAEGVWLLGCIPG